MNLKQTAAAAIARARDASGLTVPEFDMQIVAQGIGGIYGPLGNEIYTLANSHLPAVEAGLDNRLDERDANHRALWADLQPEMKAYARRCRERRYTGWSYASRAFGRPVQYAS